MKKATIKFKLLVLGTIFLSLSQLLHAQPGSLDLSFNPGNSAWPIKAMKIQNDGKIIIGGCFRSYNDIPIHHVARINTDGSRDTSFHSGLDSLNAEIDALAIQNDGKILIGGYFNRYNGIPINNSDYINIARLNPNGSLDTTFHIELNFTDSFDYVKSILIQNDGKILVGGDLYPYKGIIRLNVDGTLDTTFIDSAFIPIYKTMLLQNDNKIVFPDYAENVIRLNINGSIDSGFVQGTGADSTLQTIGIQNDGKILVGGDFNSYNGIQQKNIVRLNTDGTIDNSFNAHLKFNNQISNIVCQSDGKIIIGIDTFYTYPGYKFETRIERLYSDGSLDTTFYTGAGANDLIKNILLQSDDKIMISGYFDTYNGQSTKYFARLNGGSIYVPENSFNSQLSVYPNPTNGELFIQYTNADKLNYEVSDISGKLLMKGVLNSNNTTIDLSKAESGLYILNCNGQKVKVIKQ
jgi:uncharacterized delta-60 repeat protein